MNKITNSYKKVVFWYDKFNNLTESDHTVMGSISYNYNSVGTLQEFIQNKIEALKMLNCSVFQIGIYNVVESLDHSFEIREGGEQLEIL